MKKSYSNLEIMKNFGLNNIPGLDVCVLGALELFQKEKIPSFDVKFKRPLVVGSGNAEATGRILFEDHDAVFASESNFEVELREIKSIDGVVIVSASGGKHAPIIAKVSKKYKKRVLLITCNPNSKAKKYVDNVIVFPKQREPYTYNTSTYMSMILSKTKENPIKIEEYIKNKIDKLKFPDFKKYKKIYVILPGEFSVGLPRMVQVKFIELFGREISRDVETIEYVKHATTVTPSKDELFISFGVKNNKYGEKKNRLFVPLPKRPNYASVMAICYYVVGKIQKAHQPYFKENIVNYTKKASKLFGEKINPIVD